MNKQDWIEYFRAVNDRDPSPQEFMEAKNNGEFVVGEASSVVNSTLQMASETTGKVKKLKFPTSIVSVLSALDMKWLFRQYVITLLFVMFLYMVGSHKGISFGYIVLCTLLNPWARFVWISIMNFFFEGTNLFFATRLHIMFAIKIGVYFFVWCLSPILAPIGFLYLYLRITIFKK
ncbi:TPA: hypothetical protein ACGOYC_001224 [Streptococcus suis]